MCFVCILAMVYGLLISAFEFALLLFWGCLLFVALPIGHDLSESEERRNQRTLTINQTQQACLNEQITQLASSISFTATCLT